MKHLKVLTTSFTLFIFLAIALTACAPTQQTAAPTNTTAPTPTFPPTYTSEPPGTPVPTFTPPPGNYLYIWPISAPTDAQIQAALDCENQNWGKIEDFSPASYQVDNPTTTCDFAMQAISTVESPYRVQLEGQGFNAAQLALLENPWIILADPAFYNVFHNLNIVAPPPFVYSKLESVKISYSWEGDNDPIAFEINITNNGSITATGVVENRNINKQIKSQDFATLGKALENLLPLPQQASLSMCENHEPDWVVTLMYNDGTEITLKSNKSTLFGLGGPFQTNIDGQDYLLVSSSFQFALNEIIGQLAIELGSPNDASCDYIPIAGTLLETPLDLLP